MSYLRSTDATFLGTLRTWLSDQTEILVLIRYSGMGSKDWEFFTSYDAICKRISELRPLTCITAFKQRQLPFRGIVDDNFIASCLQTIPNGSEFLLVENSRRDYGSAPKVSWFHSALGESHKDLHEELENFRGISVAVGLIPPWLEDSDVVISAVVPDEDGETGGGIY